MTVVCQSETGRELFTKLFEVGFSQALLPLNERLSAQNFNTLISTTFHKVNDFHKSQNVNDFGKKLSNKVLKKFRPQEIITIKNEMIKKKKKCL